MQDRPLAAAGCILTAMAVIGFIDQYVQVIAQQSSLWTFHLIRSVMMWALALVALAVLGQRLRVVSWRGVIGRAGLISTGLLIYFGALGFLPVAEAAAGLFTAPLFVLVFSVVIFRLRIGPVRVAAALVGFLGVVLVLAPDLASITFLSFLPMAAGAFYGMGTLTTRTWCRDESAIVLTLAGFAALGLWGVGGLAMIEAVVGPGDSFLTRGWVWPTPQVWGLIVLQAVGSLIAVLLLTRGYQLAEASYVSIFEYSVLGFSAAFGWWLFGTGLPVQGLVGLALIAAAGAVIALRGRAREGAGS